MTQLSDHATRQSILHIEGMHCGNCAFTVERQLKTLPRVASVKAAYPSGRTTLEHEGELDLASINAALAPGGYKASLVEEEGQKPRLEARAYVEIAAAFVILGAVALALQHFHLLPRGLSVSDQMSYGLVFLIGLVASVSSCLAVTGGLLVAFAAKYNEANSTVGDKQFLKSMIPHHSGAILMCRQAQIKDPEITKLCGDIVKSQREEISKMRAILNRL